MVLSTSMLLVSAGALHGQHVSVEWERGMVPPGSPSATLPFVELSLAINPVDPDHWVVAAIQPDPEVPNTENRCTTFSTDDAGRSWHETLLDVPQCFDPWVAFSSRRTVVFVALSRGGLKLLRSPDGGRTWLDTTMDFGFGHDHPVLASTVDSSGTPNGVFLVSSRPGGGIAVIAPIDSSGSRLAAEPVELRQSNLNINVLKSEVLADGTLVAPFIDYRSMRRGETDAQPMERRRVWAYRSGDLRSVPPPIFVTDKCGSARGFAELAADRSLGAFHDRLYFACFHYDGQTAIVARSEDRGQRWSTTVAVPPILQPGRLARTLSIAVGPEGIVGLSWYDRRHDPDNECQYVYFTASLDGGVTFSEPTRVSTAESCPGAAGNRNGWSAQRWQGGGDYSGLAALPDGRFVITWADSRSGVYQPFAAVVHVTQ